MYLKGSKLRMDKQRRMRRSNPALIILFIAIIGAVIYFDQFVVEALPLPQAPTYTPSPIPESLENEADLLFEEGNLHQAIEVYNQAILLDPHDPTLHVKLAHTLTLAGRYEEAQTSAQNALLLNPENPKALAELGRSLNLMGDIVGAEDALKQALELDPNSVEAHAYYAEVLMDQDLVEDAAFHSRKAVELDPASLDARRARGYVLYMTGNYDEAEVEFAAALDINDRVSDLHLYLGLVYWAQGRLDEAINEFNLADTFDPNNPYPDVYISRIYIYLGEFAKAAQFAKSAVENDPTNPLRWANWGTALYKNRQYQEAIDAFSMAIHGGTTADGHVVVGLPLSYEPGVAEYFSLYGLALVYTRQCGEAIPIFQAIIAGVPADNTSVDNANTGIAECESYAANPPTSTPLPTATEGLEQPTPSGEPPQPTQTSGGMTGP
jgi:tetratricopeptide (TPR) repeat protein